MDEKSNKAWLDRFDRREKSKQRQLKWLEEEDAKKRKIKENVGEPNPFCLKCEGSGQIECNRCYGYGMVDCISCNGKGGYFIGTPPRMQYQLCGCQKGKLPCSKCEGTKLTICTCTYK